MSISLVSLLLSFKREDFHFVYTHFFFKKNFATSHILVHLIKIFIKKNKLNYVGTGCQETTREQRIQVTPRPKLVQPVFLNKFALEAL